MKKFSPNFERDWNFYVANKDKFTFCGQIIPEIAEDPNGKSAKECFHALDSRGVLPPCRESKLLWEVIRAKKSINFQIKAWAEDYEYMWLDFPVQEMLKSFEGSVPDWVGDALRKQIKKRFENPRAREVVMKILDMLWKRAIEKIQKEDNNPSTKGDV